MAVGLITANANLLVAAFTTGTTFQNTGWHIQLHSADPGAAGTSNVSTAFTNRVQVPAWNAAASGARTNNGAITWNTAATGQTITHFSAWSASTAGTCYCTGTVSGGTISAGNNFSIPTGDFSISFGPLAA